MVGEIQSCHSWWLMLEVEFRAESRHGGVERGGPQPHGGIDAGGGQGVPVGVERHTPHLVGVAGQGLAQRARVGRVGEVPQPHGVIAAGGGQGVPVGS